MRDIAAVAAVSLRLAHTVLVGGLALVLCLLLAVYDNLLDSRRAVIALATIAGVTVAGAIASAGRHRRERDLADVSAVAEAAQRVLLRPVPALVGPVEVAVRYISATATARIGGDLYEVIAAGQAVRLIVADVQGKGLAAVQTAALVLGAFREAAYDAAGLAEIAALIDLSLQRQAPAEEFVTAVIAQIPAGSQAIEILNCGHPPPLGVDGDAVREIEPAETNLPLGLAQPAPVRTGRHEKVAQHLHRARPGADDVNLPVSVFAQSHSLLLLSMNSLIRAFLFSMSSGKIALSFSRSSPSNAVHSPASGGRVSSRIFRSRPARTGLCPSLPIAMHKPPRSTVAGV